MDLVEQLKADEGFRAAPYRDSRGVLTIGYGTNLEAGITRAEAEWLLEQRLLQARLEFARRWHRLNELPAGVQDALVGMAYQLGVRGALGFRRMLAALEEQPPNYRAAIREARDSAWNRQTPQRVDRLVAAFREPRSRLDITAPPP